MSNILRKELLQTTRLASQKYSQATADCDVIVPDVCPDIKKILDVSGYISISEKSLLGGKVYIQGTVYMTVLYVPDGETLNKVKSLSASQPFNHSIDLGQVSDSLILSTDIEAEQFGYTLINSRKINLRCTIGANVKLFESESFEIASSADLSNEICAQSQKLCLCDTPVSFESRILLSSQAELPSNNPSIGEILKANVSCESSELIVSENSALAKGQARICFLYTSYNDGSVHSSEVILPFEETLDVSGLEEDMEAEIEYLLDHIQHKVQEDSDGEPRIFDFEIGLSAHLKGIRIYEPEILCDAYALSGKLNCSSLSLKLEQLVNNTTAQLTHKTSVRLPDHLPEIAKICDISAVASVDRILVNDKGITVFGHIKSDILYTTTDEAYPLCSFSDASEFTHIMPSPVTDEDLICEARIFTEHTSYTMNNSDSIDIRTVLGLSVRSFTERTVSPIVEAEHEIVEDAHKKPAICIFFAQEGDTLWDIAKKYRTTVEKLYENNNLTSDHITVGQQIRIC